MYVVNTIPVTTAAIDISSHVQFHGIGPMPAYEHGNVVVDLLVPLDVRRGNPGQPFDTRTLFGWCVNGQSPMNVPSRRVISNFVSS